MGQRPSVQYHSWDGVYAATFTLAGMRSHCAAFAQALVAHKWSCIVAADTRFMAAQFALDALHVLSDAGVSCSYCATPVPFPAVELGLEQRIADCALVVSAGNKPSWFLGLHAITPPVETEIFHESVTAALFDYPFPAAQTPPASEQVNLRGPYIETLRAAVDIDLLRRTSLTIFVDPMSGTCSGYIPAVLGEGSQIKAIEINRDLDPLFGRQTPHPIESGVQRLRKLVRESDSQLGVAFSADGQSCVIVDNHGDVVTAFELALILGTHLSRQYRQRGALIMPPDESIDQLPGGVRWLDEYFGLRVEQTEQTGARIAEQVGRDRGGLVVGITQSGEVTLGRYAAVPDAILTALVLLEAIARSGLKLRQLLATIRKA